MPPKILYLLNDAPFFYTHRVSLARSVQDKDWSVHVAIPHADEPLQKRFKEDRFILHQYRTKRNKLSVLKSIFVLYGILRMVRPDLVHIVTLKCTIMWFFNAPFFWGMPSVHTLAGFGQLAGTGFWPRMGKRIIECMIWILSRYPKTIFVVQNETDYNDLKAREIIPGDRIRLVQGSGVDTEIFKPAHTKTPNAIAVQKINGIRREEPRRITHTSATKQRSASDFGNGYILRIGTAARRLNSKGFPALAMLAHACRESGLPVRFVVASSAASGHHDAVSDDYWRNWLAADLFEDAGHVTDMPAFYQSLDAFIYLSMYGEGLAKTLLEAGACTLPIITTPQHGCQDAVQDGVTGYICDPMDQKVLMDRIAIWANNHDTLVQMGAASRALIIDQFSDPVVIGKMQSIYNELLN